MIIQLRENGEITLPDQIRRELNLHTGSLLHCESGDGFFKITPLVKKSRRKGNNKLFW